MVRLTAVLLAAALFQADEDPLGKLKAPPALAKAQKEWAKKKGCWFLLDLTSTLLTNELRGEEKAEYAGKVVKDFFMMKGPAEIYGRGADKLVRKDDKFLEPKKADGKLNRLATVARNPALVVAELFRFAGAAAFGADEKLGEIECRIVETVADERSVYEQVREVTSGLKSLDAYYIKDMTAVTDKKRSTSTYKVWLSRVDLAPVKLEWTLTIVLNKKAIPFGADEIPDQFEAAYVYQFSKYDSDLGIDVPPAVRQRFGAPAGN